MKYCLKFNGCPVFFGTREECEKKMRKDYSGRAQRFCRIDSPERLQELAKDKMINSECAAKHLGNRRRSFSQDGDVEYYD